MASMKNAIPKRKYRERGQLDWRKEKGFLEKKVDWKKRVGRYNRDQDTQKKKKLQASLKNTDEFYHKMISLTKTKGELNDKANDRANKNLLNYHMMKIKKQQRKNEDSLIHEYTGKHVILADDDFEVDDEFQEKNVSSKDALTKLKNSESKLKIAKEERRISNVKLHAIQEKMNEISKNNLNKKVKKLRTRLR